MSDQAPKSLYALLWLALILLSVLPLGMLFLTAISAPAAIVRIMAETQTLAALWHSFYTSALATLIAGLLGAVFAYLLVISDVRGKRWLIFAFMLPMMIPPQVSALAWLQISGPASPLLNTLGIAPPLGSPQPLYSAHGIALLLGIQSAPLVFMALRAQLLNIPQELIEAARMSGAGGWRLWRDTVLPLSRAGIISGAALAFIASLGNFGIPAMLGIPIGYHTLPTLIYQKMADFGNAVLSQIATLALCIGLLTLVCILLQQFLLKRSEFALIGQAKMRLRMALGRWRLAVECALWLLLALILFLPLAALIAASFVPAIGMPLSWDSLSLEAYREVLFRQQATLRALSNSLSLSSVAALLLMLLSLAAVYVMQRLRGSWRVLVFTLIDLPYALPGVVLAIACILLFVKPLPLLNVQIYASIWIIFIAYLMRFFSVALKPVYAAAGQLGAGLEQAAQLAGANSFQRIRDILLPLLAPACAAGAILVFLTAVNELTVSALLWSAGSETLGVMVYNLEDGGSSVLAAALSVIVVLMVLALMLLLSLIGRRLPAGVIPWEEER